MDRRALGREAEVHARDYLIAQGLTILHENFLCRMGELDLIALHGNVLVIVEVRSRIARGFGDAADSIDRRKQARVIRATRYFLLKHREFNRYPVRFDVVTLDAPAPGAKCRIAWIRHAFALN